MSQVAADLLARRYELRGARVHIIPHGIPDMAPRDQDELKARFGVAGQRMLLTFGLLGPNKGIETVIRALPAARRRLSRSRLLRRRRDAPGRRSASNGEAYRTTLEREAERLGVREHVVFRDQYVTTEELCSYLQAADVFVSPYLNEAQVTSGALSYAMGAGAAVVSTPYWHAKELLADGRGRLFPFGDSVAPRDDDHLRCSTTPAELARVRQPRLRVHARVHLAARRRAVPGARRDAARRPPRERRRRAEPPRASSLPELRLDHLLRLTDDTGIIQHATFSVPGARERLLRRRQRPRADRRAARRSPERLARRPSGSSRRTSAFCTPRRPPTGRFRNFMSYDRVVRARTPASDDCTGRALWALGTTAHLARDEGQRMLARQMFERGLPPATELGPRGTALTMLGLTAFLDRAPGGRRPPPTLLARARGAALPAIPRTRRPPDWRWFEPTLTYDNALLPLALLRAHALTTRSGEPRRRARGAGVPRGRPASGTIAWSWSATPAGTRAAGRAPTPTSSRSTPRRSCSRSAARTS